MSRETLAEVIGTTRPRVGHFMNKFRKLGFITFSGHCKPKRSLLIKGKIGPTNRHIPLFKQ
jgi:CRP/FNR family cyclic AMP-dependent transcriptional regulator